MSRAVHLCRESGFARLKAHGLCLWVVASEQFLPITHAAGGPKERWLEYPPGAFCRTKTAYLAGRIPVSLALATALISLRRMR